MSLSRRFDHDPISIHFILRSSHVTERQYVEPGLNNSTHMPVEQLKITIALSNRQMIKKSNTSFLQAFVTKFPSSKQ